MNWPIIWRKSDLTTAPSVITVICETKQPNAVVTFYYLQQCFIKIPFNQQYSLEECRIRNVTEKLIQTLLFEIVKTCFISNCALV